jgi:hypothetical protein
MISSPCMYQAIQDYAASKPSELNLSKGDSIEVTVIFYDGYCHAYILLFFSKFQESTKQPLKLGLVH